MRLQHLSALVAAAAVVVATPMYAGAATADVSRRVGPPAAGVPEVAAAKPSAEDLLAEAKAAFADRAATSGRGQSATAHGADMTLLLRDLNARRNELSPADRKAADGLLARPTGGATYFGERYRTKAKHKCYRHVCIHWVTKGENRPPLFDGRDRNRLPEWVEANGKTAEHVWKQQVTRAGYRAPRADWTSKNHGPNKKLDIYLANLGDSGLYGFCTTDDPRRSRQRSVSAYCVVDNDFSRREFGAKPIKTLRVTVAHEFFHAVQYGYDWLEDAWLLEGTATWIEEQVYDGINDNRQYLRRNSPHTDPEVPLDLFDSFSYPQYGVWGFFQYLGERYPAESGGMPKVIRDVWRYADNKSRYKPRQYSAQAVDSALRARGSNMTNAVAEFGAVNLLPARFYSEGSHWPVAPTRRTCAPAEMMVGCAGAGDLDHLTSYSVKLLPGAGTILDVSVVMADPAGSAATLTLVSRTGVPTRYRLAVDGTSKEFPFSDSAYSYATLTLTNAGIRYVCWQQSPFSCQGVSQDDERPASYSAKTTS